MPSPTPLSSAASLFLSALHDSAATPTLVPQCCILLCATSVPSTLLDRIPDILSSRPSPFSEQPGHLSWLIGYARDAVDELQFLWACLALLAAAHAFPDADIKFDLSNGFSTDKRRALQYGTTALASLLSSTEGQVALAAYVTNPLFAWTVFKDKVGSSVLCDSKALSKFIALPKVPLSNAKVRELWDTSVKAKKAAAAREAKAAAVAAAADEDGDVEMDTPTTASLPLPSPVPTTELRRSTRPASAAANEQRQRAAAEGEVIDQHLRQQKREVVWAPKNADFLEEWNNRRIAPEPLSVHAFVAVSFPTDDRCCLCLMNGVDTPDLEWISLGCQCRAVHRHCIAGWLTRLPQTCPTCRSTPSLTPQPPPPRLPKPPVTIISAPAVAPVTRSPRVRPRENSHPSEEQQRRDDRRKEQEQALERRKVAVVNSPSPVLPVQAASGLRAALSRFWQKLFPRKVAPSPLEEKLVNPFRIGTNIIRGARKAPQSKGDYVVMLRQLKLNLRVDDYEKLLCHIAGHCTLLASQFVQRRIPVFSEAPLYHALLEERAFDIDFSHVDLLAGTGAFSIGFQLASDRLHSLPFNKSSVGTKQYCGAENASTVLFLDEKQSAVETCKLNFAAEVRRQTLNDSFDVSTIPYATIVSCGIPCQDVAARNNRKKKRKQQAVQSESEDEEDEDGSEEESESEEEKEPDEEKESDKEPEPYEEKEPDKEKKPVITARTRQVVDTLLRLAAAENAPRCFVLECGANLVRRTEPKQYLDETMQRFEQCGYRWDYTLLNTKDFRLPQHRQRMYAVVFKGSKEHWQWPAPMPQTESFLDYLDKPEQLVGHTCWLGNNEKGQPEDRPSLPGQQLYVRETCALFAHGEKAKIVERKWEQQNLKREPHLMPAITGAWGNCRSNRPVLLDGATKETARWRFLTAEELSRLQGLPSWYRFWQNRRQYKSRHADQNLAVELIGNAVSVPVAQAVMESVMKALAAQDGKVLPRVPVEDGLGLDLALLSLNDKREEEKRPFTAAPSPSDVLVTP